MGACRAWGEALSPFSPRATILQKMLVCRIRFLIRTMTVKERVKYPLPAPHGPSVDQGSCGDF